MSGQSMFPHYHQNGDVDVFDKDGVKHTMPRLNAYDMVTHCGWFPGVPQVARKAHAPEVRVLVSKTATPAPETKVEDTTEVTLNLMEKPALIEFAKVHFGMDFADTVSKDDILNAILAEQG